MNKFNTMLQTAALSLLLIGGAHAGTGKAAPANKAAVVAATPAAKHGKAVSNVAMKVNINTADAAAIDEALLNVGPSKAAAIVAYRKQHGAFHTADQLAEVKGIGLKTVEKNRDRIVIGGIAPASTAKR
jgi:competence ComEA-like helix-hairpin-helix protein